MTEKMVSFVLGAGRAMGLAPSAGEPSHIHVVRRRRVAQGTEGKVATARTLPEPGGDAEGDAEADGGGEARLAVAA